MTELAQRLETVKGKKSYGYLPKTLKPLVDSIVDEMERLPMVAECYETWWQLLSPLKSEINTPSTLSGNYTWKNTIKGKRTTGSLSQPTKAINTLNFSWTAGTI